MSDPHPPHRSVSHGADRPHERKRGEEAGVLDDVLELTDNYLCPDGDILEELAVELPYYELCEPDCPGLCPICGKPKRDGDCGCEARAAEEAKKEIDPRLAKLKKLLEKPE